LFNNDQANQIIKGVNTCTYNTANPNSNPSSTGSGPSPTTTKKNSAAVFDPSAPLTGLSAIIAAILFL
jgi:hypothetical protein